MKVSCVFLAALPLQEEPRWTLWLVYGVLSGLLGYLLGFVFLRVLLKIASKTPTEWDSVVLKSFDWPINVGAALWAVSFVYRFVPTPAYLEPYLSAYRTSLNVVLIALLFVGMLRFLSKAIELERKKNESIALAAGMFKPVLVIVFAVVGLLMILQEFGINVLPVLTSLGIGGIAVALALQSTLANFFAGLSLLSDRQIRQGDFISLESGLEGWVQEVRWRSTLIKTRENNVVIIPNLKLAESVLTNFHLPQSWMIVRVPFGVSYASDPSQISRVVIEEIEKIAKERDFILLEPKPTCRLHPGFGESSLDFSLRVAIRGYEDQFEARDLIRRRIFDRFRQEGIEIPFPQRDVHLRGRAPNSG